MAELIFPNITGQYQQGLAFGTELRQTREAEGRRNRLADLVAQAYGADPNARQGLLQQAVGVDPEAGLALSGGLADEDKRREQMLLNTARLIDSAPPEMKGAIFQQVRPQIAQYLPNLPAVYGDQVGQGIKAFIQSRTRPEGLTAEQQNFAAMTGQFTPEQIQQARLIQAGLQPRAGLPTIGEYAGGVYGVNRNTLQAQPVQLPGAQPPAPQGAGAGSFAESIASLVAPLGGRITSTTGGQHNVGSLHPSGAAVDIGMGQESPEQQAQILATLQANPNLIVRDERTRPPGQAEWSGPHLHVEQRPQAAQGGGQLQPAPKTPAGYRRNAAGTLEMEPGGPAEVAAQAREDARAARNAAEEAKAEQKQQVVRQRQAEASTAANDLVNAVDQLTQHPGFQALGTELGDLQIATPIIRNAAKDADAKLKNIAGQVALATMARLKALSTQGATGFGALTAPELRLLENSIDTLQAEKISNEQLQSSLKTIRDKMEKVINWQPPANEAPRGTQRARNPQTGEVLILVNGQWVPE